MTEYKDFKTGVAVVMSGDKSALPASGNRIYLKGRPPIAKEVRTD